VADIPDVNEIVVRIQPVGGIGRSGRPVPERPKGLPARDEKLIRPRSTTRRPDPEL
jgi:hypothetical protein